MTVSVTSANVSTVGRCRIRALPHICHVPQKSTRCPKRRREVQEALRRRELGDQATFLAHVITMTDSASQTSPGGLSACPQWRP